MLKIILPSKFYYFKIVEKPLTETNEKHYVPEKLEEKILSNENHELEHVIELDKAEDLIQSVSSFI